MPQPTRDEFLRLPRFEQARLSALGMADMYQMVLEADRKHNRPLDVETCQKHYMWLRRFVRMTAVYASGRAHAEGEL